MRCHKLQAPAPIARLPIYRDRYVCERWMQRDRVKGRKRRVGRKYLLPSFSFIMKDTRNFYSGGGSSCPTNEACAFGAREIISETTKGMNLWSASVEWTFLRSIKRRSAHTDRFCFDRRARIARTRKNKYFSLDNARVEPIDRKCRIKVEFIGCPRYNPDVPARDPHRKANFPVK